MSSTALDRPQALSSGVRWVVRVLLAGYGVVTALGVGYFTFFASPAEGGVSTAGDWVVATWGAGMAVAFLVAAVRLGERTRRSVRLALGAVLSHVAFGVLKYVGYGETEAVGFFAFDLLLLALLAVLARSR